MDDLCIWQKEPWCLSHVYCGLVAVKRPGESKLSNDTGFQATTFSHHLESFQLFHLQKEQGCICLFFFISLNCLLNSNTNVGSSDIGVLGDDLLVNWNDISFQQYFWPYLVVSLLQIISSSMASSNSDGQLHLALVNSPTGLDLRVCLGWKL